MSTTVLAEAQPIAIGSGADIIPLSVIATNRSTSQQSALVVEDHHRQATRLQKATVTFILAGINFASSSGNGLVVVGLPRITQDLSLPSSLAFWPSSVSGLATASTLLLAGSIADVVGVRSVELLGCIISGVLLLASGFVRTGEELVALRALQGVGMAMHFASSVALITKILPQGRGRNLAFSCLGLSQPLGFSFGLVIGGVLVDTIGWRSGWYIYGALTLLLTGLGFWALPRNKTRHSAKELLHKVWTEVDWVGSLLASAFMALLCYTLAILSADVYRIKEPGTIAMLIIGVLMLPSFGGWVHRQVKIGQPALIPNSVWKQSAFTAICVTIGVSFAVTTSMELFSSLFFQEVQHLPALQAALRILPSLIVGTVLNLTTGFVVHKIPVVYLTVLSCILTAGSPLLMAIIQPQWTYWGNAFVAQLLVPISADVLFTVGLIIITNVFPDEKHAVAGAIFNTATQFGNAFGLAILQVISSLVTRDHAGLSPVAALLEGYRASFWTMFAFMLSCAILGGVGLRKAGKIGLKTE